MILAIQGYVDNSRNAIDNEQIPALDDLIAEGVNDHVLSSEIAEATAAKANAVAQQGLDATWEANIDLGQGSADLSTPTLTARQTDISTRLGQITTRDAEIDVTLATRVTPPSLYDSRFAWIANRARLTNGSIVLIKQAGEGVVQVNAQVADNQAEIDRINGILSQKQHSTDAFLSL